MLPSRVPGRILRFPSLTIAPSLSAARLSGLDWMSLAGVDALMGSGLTSLDSLFHYQRPVGLAIQTAV
jgi:hypothetical protein